MKNTLDIFAGTYLACNLDRASTAVFVRMGRQGHKNHYIKDNGRRENNCVQEEKTVTYKPQVNKFAYLFYTLN